MTAMRVRLSPGRSVDRDAFTDITTIPCTATTWEPEGWLRLVFDGDLTADEQRRIAWRVMSETSHEEQLRADAAAYLTKTSPTTAETTTQVRRLTALVLRLNDAVIEKPVDEPTETPSQPQQPTAGASTQVAVSTPLIKLDITGKALSW
ncbi:hypothetical protein [Microcystis phage MinS1]|nr:hypothetical protein [Microcystis phage MinS1]